MKKRLIIYNPEHDEALAANLHYYTPSKAAQIQFEKWKNKTLPWQKEDDLVWTDQSSINWDNINEIAPFGWDRAICQRLRKAGAPIRLLPTEEQLEHLRRLSSRETCTTLLPLLRAEIPQSFGENYWCTHSSKIEELLALHHELIAKTPWSCAGRGVFRFDHKSYPLVKRRIEKCLWTQKGIEVEPYYEHSYDFALEWEYQNANAIFIGVNHFKSINGQFCENLPLSDLPLPKEKQQLLIQAIQKYIPKIFKTDYVGPFGIDMMLNANGEIHPCVEINLRRTMALLKP